MAGRRDPWASHLARFAALAPILLAVAVASGAALRGRLPAYEMNEHVLLALALLFGLTSMAAAAVAPLGRCAGGLARAVVAPCLVVGIPGCALSATEGHGALDALLVVAPWGWLALGAVAIAARASASRRWLARSRVLAWAAVALLALGTVAAFSRYIGPPSPHASMLARLTVFALARGEASAVRLYADVLAAICLFAGARPRRVAFRWVFAAGGIACVGAALVQLFELRASGLVAAGLAAAWSNDLRGFEGLAAAATATEAVAGVIVGLVGAIGVAKLVPASVGSRALACMVLPLAVVATWLVSPTEDAGLWHWLDPAFPRAWRANGVEPVVTDGPVDFLFGRQRTTWFIDAEGVAVAWVAGQIESNPRPWIVADARAPLGSVAAYVRGLPRTASLERASLARRHSASRALDALTGARARFPLLEVSSRGGSSLSLRVGSASELAACLRGELGCLPDACAITGSWAASADCDGGWRLLVLDAIPADATANELARADVDAVFVIDAEGAPRADVVARPSVEPAAPVRARSPFVPMALATLVGAAFAMLAAARWRWPARIPSGALVTLDPLPTGTLTPAWIARRACDARVTLPHAPTYRASASTIGRATARSFARAVALTAWEAARRTWPSLLAAVLVGLALWQLGD